MKRILFARCGFLRHSLLAVPCLLIAPRAQAVSPNVVISQVFGGGGNSGASIRYDYIELFNTSSANITLIGYSLQYASAKGTSTFLVGALPTITLGPGQFYLVEGASGTSGGDLPLTPDAAVSLNLSGSSGKLALVSSTAALSGACPTSNTIVDLVGYGSTNCAEGGDPAPGESATLADVRKNVCEDTDNNANDFTTVTAGSAIHNSASSEEPCSGTQTLSASGGADPSTVAQGGTTLLTVAASPLEAGLSVTADLSGIGGSVNQILYDDGTHGDVTAGDGTFSFTATISGSTPIGPVTLQATATNSAMQMASASISLTVVAPIPVLAIHTVQGAMPGQSPYIGQSVQTSGIVTGVKATGFFLQVPDAEADGDPRTPEGILVYTGSKAKPTYVAVGNRVQVTGKVAAYPTTSKQPGTEIDSPALSLVSTGNPLPTPILINRSEVSPTGNDGQLLQYQSMRVSVMGLTATSGTDGVLTETAETNVSNGQFYAVIEGVVRPFREPGIDVNDTIPAGAPAGIPIFDDNPERLLVSSAALGGLPINLSSGSLLSGPLTGIIDYSAGLEGLDLDASSAPLVTGGQAVTPVPDADPGEFTVGAFNMERFYNATADTPGAVVVTPAAYARRLVKGSLAIRDVLKMPDVLGVEEMENISALTDLAKQISTDAQAAGQLDPQYLPYLEQGNDPSAINVGFLIKSARVTVKDVTQFGKSATFTNPATGQQAELNDRPPLVLHAGIHQAGAADYPVTVIVNHLRSLLDIDDPAEGATVRAKREAQAEYLANLIEGYQRNGEHVISVGDYNAFEFSDGYVDTLGAIEGHPAPADQVVLASPGNLVSPNLTDLGTLVQPETQRYSYVEDGSAQVLDHVLITQDLLAGAHLAYGRVDADFPLVDLNDVTTPARISDHDPVVAYFPLPAAPFTLTLQLTGGNATAQMVGLGQPVTARVLLGNGGGPKPDGTLAIVQRDQTGDITVLSTIAVGSLTLSNGYELDGSYSQLSLGTHQVYAVYAGDSRYPPQLSSPVSVTVLPFNATVSLTVGSGPFMASAPIAYSGKVTGSVPAVVPTGSVYFFDRFTYLGTQPLINGGYSGSAQLASGANTITVIYGGDANYRTPSATQLILAVQ